MEQTSGGRKNSLLLFLLLVLFPGPLIGLILILLSRDDGFSGQAYLSAGVMYGAIAFFWLMKLRKQRKGIAMILVRMLALAVFIWSMILLSVSGHSGEMERMRIIRQLQPGSIIRIDVCADKRTTDELTRISDKAILDAFADASKDAQIYRPNHPYYTWTRYLVVQTTDERAYELECHLESGKPDVAICYFVHKSGWGMTTYFGTFSSKGLRRWFEEYLHAPGNRAFRDPLNNPDSESE